MDAARFDTLARAFTHARSRRGALAALGGALVTLGLAPPEETAARKSGKCKRTCGECERCAKGKCKKKNGKKRCKKGVCEARPDTTPCSLGSCRGGVCTDRNVCSNAVCPDSSTPAAVCGSGAFGSCLCFGAATGAGQCVTVEGVAACGLGGTCANPAQQCISVCGTFFCLSPCPTPAP